VEIKRFIAYNNMHIYSPIFKFVIPACLLRARNYLLIPLNIQILCEYVKYVNTFYR